MAGKKLPASIPALRLSFALWVTRPTTPGPMDPPKSPAIASSANIAVPPSGILPEAMLMVPGHIIPTEKPQIMQPARLRSGNGARAESR